MRQSLVQPVRNAVAREVCEHLDMHRQTLAHLTKSGILPFAKNEKGQVVQHRYNLRDTVRAYVRYLKENARSAAPVASAAAYDLARAERMRASADMAKMQKEVMQGSLLLREDVEAFFGEVVFNVRNKFLGLPYYAFPQLGLELSTEESARCIRKLNELVREILTDLARLEGESAQDEIRARNKKVAEFAQVQKTLMEEEEDKSHEVSPEN